MRQTSYSLPPTSLARRSPLPAALLLTLLAGLTPSAAVLANSRELLNASVDAGLPSLDTETGLTRYVVMFREPALAAFDGTSSTLRRAPMKRSSDGRARLDATSTEARDYVAALDASQLVFVYQASATLGRQVEVIDRYQHALNAVVLALSEAEASALRNNSDVESVELEPTFQLDTYASQQFIGAPTLWNSPASPGGLGYKGEGIVVGVIDTGVNYLSQSFRAAGDDNFPITNPLGAGQYLGVCATPASAGMCNNKLIGAFGNSPSATTIDAARDLDGHGSHTGSTAAGVVSDVVVGGGQFRFSGVAPHANVVTFNACPPAGCTTLASINQAVATGVIDVINYSIGGPNTGPWSDSASTAFRNAVAAGIFVAKSAGNDGPDDAFTNAYDPWTTSVASTTPNRTPGFQLSSANLPNPLTLGSGGAPLPSISLPNRPLIESPNFADGANDGCAAYPANHFRRPQTAEGTQGIAVLHLDGTSSACASGARRTAALNAGAEGVIFVDVPRLNLGASGTTYSMLLSEWQALRTQLGDVTATGNVVVSVSGLTATPRDGDVLSGFSSRGPTRWGTLKPDVAAPGDVILAAISPTTAAAYVGDVNQAVARTLYGNNSGTSMASPHVAGAAALVRQARPDWSPMEVKSALMTTAVTDIRLDNGTQASPNQRGAGRIDLTRVIDAGIVLDETVANMLAANPSTGGSPEALNLASYYHLDCVGSCVFPRTVRSTGKLATWTIAVEGLPGSAYTLDKTSFSLSARGQASYALTVNTASLSKDQWYFGQVVLTPSDASIAVARMPLAIRASAGKISADVETINASVAVGTTRESTIAINNAGNPLTWRVENGRMQGNLVHQPMVERVALPAPTLFGFRNGTYGTGVISSTVANNFYIADYFDALVDDVRITDLRYDGWLARSNTRLTMSRFANQFAWYVWSDANGMPNGRPGSTVAGDLPPVFQYPAANGGAALGNPRISLPTATPGDAASGMRLELGDLSFPVNRGRYWFNASPTIATTTDTTAVSLTSIADKPLPARVTQPNATNRAWLVPASGTTAIVGSAVPMTIGANVPCGASWLSVGGAASGALTNGQNASLNVRIDTTGLQPGDYAAYLCVSTDGTSKPLFNIGTENLLIPVRLTVTEVSDVIFASGFDSAG